MFSLEDVCVLDADVLETRIETSEVLLARSLARPRWRRRPASGSEHRETEPKQC